MSDAPAPRPKKSLFSSMTVYSTILWMGAYFAATWLKLSEDVMEGIMIVGIATIAIFMRKGLISTLDTPMEGETAESRRKISKPIYRSMTVFCALAMVVSWCAAKFYLQTSEDINHGVIIVGVAAILIFMRRGILNALG
jgi:hypothetical protein